MKTQLKYLLFAAMPALFLLNISGKVDKKQAAQTMPQIPNGDFEDQANRDWKVLIDSLHITYCCPTPPDPPLYFQKKTPIAEHLNYNIDLDSTVVFSGRYSAILKSSKEKTVSTTLENKFPLSIHPSSLNGYVRSILNDPIDHAIIRINLFKNGVLVDKGEWDDTISIKHWKEINIPITNTTMEVDSADIRIYTLFNDHQAKYRRLGRFWVDDLFFK